MGVSPADPPIGALSLPVRSGILASWLELYRTMATAREIDRVELDLVRRGLAFFHVSGAGHEASACLARHVRESDWLHVHYRDKALLLARGLPVDEFFASLLCRAGSHSEGRQMSAHYSAPRRNVLSQTGPVGNHALQAVGVAAALSSGRVNLPLPPHPQAGTRGRGEGGSNQESTITATDSVGNRVPALRGCRGVPSRTDGLSNGNSRNATEGVPYRVPSDNSDRSIVACIVGDGSTQQGEFLEAIAEAVRSRLPVLFLIEDNHLSISTSTAGRTFWNLPSRIIPLPLGEGRGEGGPAKEFYGLPIVRVDGSDVLAVDAALGEVVDRMRADPSPAIIVLDVQRLADHSNADDQTQYRDLDALASAKATADPIRRLEDYLLECGVSPNELRRILAEVASDVEAAAARALALPDPTACRTAKLPLPPGEDGSVNDSAAPKIPW